MPQGGWYTWLAIGIGALFWGASVWWMVLAMLERTADDQEKRAAGETATLRLSEDQLRDVMARYPRSSAAACGYAEYALRQGELDEALRRYEIAIARRPREARGYAGAATVLRRMKRLDESEALLQRAEKRCKNAGPLQTAFAWNAMVRQDWNEAARRWALHREFRPKERFAYEQGALALRKAGLPQEADAVAAELEKWFPKTDEPIDREAPAET